MATIKQTLDELMTLDGAMCAAVVDSASGMMLGSVGSGVDLEVAAAGNTEVIRSKMKTMRSLGLNDVIEDILITLGKQYHILRPSARKDGVFVYFVLDKQRAKQEGQDQHSGRTGVAGPLHWGRGVRRHRSSQQDHTRAVGGADKSLRGSLS